jgi:hypothetical protein
MGRIISYIILFSLLFACKNAATPKVQLDSLKVDTMKIDPPKKDTIVQSATEASLYLLDSTLPALGSLDTTKQVHDILRIIAGVDKDVRKFKITSYSIDEQTSEGGEVMVAKESLGDFIKLHGTIFGEMGKKNFQYYITKDKNAKLACAILTNVTYDRPMYQKSMKISGEETVYQIFANNKLVAVLNKNLKKQKLTNAQLKEMEIETLDFFKTYVGQVREPKAGY